METLIIVLIVLVIVVVAIVYFKSKKEVKPPSKKGPGAELPYKNWLTTMRTVFSGGTKDAQDKFLESEKDSIRRWSFYPDFVVKFDTIIKQFGK